MFVVIINCWFDSASDDRVLVYLESAESADAAKRQARQRLSIFDRQIFSIDVKVVSVEGVGLIWRED